MQQNTENNYSINVRILQIIEFYSITRYKLSQDTGVSETVLLNLSKGKNKPSVDILHKILNKYKAIDANWLLTGEGNMLKETSSVDKGEIKGKSPRDPCLFCHEKEKVIQSQGRHIETLSRQLDRCQDELDYHKDHARHRNDDGQKRKTG